MDKKYWSENTKAKYHLRNLGEDGKRTLKWAVTKQGMRVWIKFNWLATVLQWRDLVNTAINLRVP
jgi:hypothetical protein